MVPAPVFIGEDGFGPLNTCTKRIYFLEAGTRLWYF
jgi:hypothetical protein